MATSEDADPKKKSKLGLKLNLSPMQKIWIGLAIVLVFLFLLVIGGILVKARMFERNPRFTLKNIEIRPPDGYVTSYWNSEFNREKRKKELAKELQLESGTMNVFAVELGVLRKRLMDEHSEISDVIVRRELPDTLSFTITERVPLADIGRGIPNKNGASLQAGNRYLDGNGMVIDAAHCQKLTLPKIIDLSEREIGKLRPGDQVSSDGIRLALDFIQLINTDTMFKDIEVKTIALVTFNNSIQCVLMYKNADFTVILPYPVQKDKIRSDIMGRLVPVLKEQYRRHDFKSMIDLRYDKQAVIRPAGAR